MNENKSATKFLLGSGIYLFILIFFLLTQPRSGFIPETMQVLSAYLLFVPIWIAIGTLFFLDKRFVDKKWAGIIFGRKTIYLTILFSLIIGLIFNLDYHRQLGCFIMDEKKYRP